MRKLHVYKPYLISTVVDEKKGVIYREFINLI